MPINFQEIYTEVRAIAANAAQNKELLEQRRVLAWRSLEELSERLDILRENVERIVSEVDPNLRCALPVSDALMTCHPCPPPPGAASLIAVDGSQVIPDRHQSLVYGLINVGAVCLQLGAAEAPQIFTASELLFDETLRNRDGSLLDEGAIALKRDARERSLLLTLSADAPAPILALTDGPVELWGAKDSANAVSYQQFLHRYLDDLDRLHELGVILGGYVDKPGADLLIRLLEVASFSSKEGGDLRAYHPLIGVSDLWMFGRLLKPGERSAIFAMQSGSRTRYTGARAIHFFYLNVSTTGRPVIARVECPQWVAADPQKLDLLHACLVSQSSLLGARPYPFVLHRAHETAKVSFDEKGQVEMFLALELRQQGVDIGDPSEKQVAKNTSATKGSYKR